MRILHLSAVNNWGGGEKHIENLCLELAESNPEIFNTILCKKGCGFEKSLKNSGLNYHTVSTFTNLDPRYFISIIKICRNEKIDLIHIHDPTALALAIIADKLANLPDFIFSKKTSFPVKKRSRSRYKYNYPKIKKILCVSDFSKRIISESLEIKNKAIRIYHGIRPERQNSLLPTSTLRAQFNIPENTRIVGNIANHTWPKDLACLVETANQLINKQKRKDLIFVQIGGFTSETKKIQKQIKELKLENHMLLTGFQNVAPAHLKEFDYFLLTSKSEGLPNVIYEAFYHKTPVITTNVGGIPEIVTHMKNGLLAEVGDAEKLAANLLFLEENPELITRFTENGHKKLVENFTTKQMAKETLEEYKNVLYGRY